MENENKPTIPIFFACDDNFVKFTIVAITSLKANASKDYHYDIHVLYTEMSKEMKEATLELADDDFSIKFDDVSIFLKSVQYRLTVRDYYSKTTYYRFFISNLYPEYDKAVYLDSDMIVIGDISELYNTDLGDNYVGAVLDHPVQVTPVFQDYVEKVVGVSRNSYFNAGMLVMNCKAFREKGILDKFIKLLHEYSFVVAQDQDYLNVICKGKVTVINQAWNVQIFGEVTLPPEEFKIAHYNMGAKPWHYDDCRFKEFFWKYAEQTSVYKEILDELKNFPEERKLIDATVGERLCGLAVEEINRADNYVNRQTLLKSVKKVLLAFIRKPEVKQSEDRLRILTKIQEYERAGRFSEDVEDDPPARPIQPGEVDYEQKKLKTKIMSAYAFYKARKFMKKMMKKHQLIIKEVRGIENLKGFKGGAMITCNHFNAFDSFAVQFIYDEIRKITKKGKFFRIIKEGNYTSVNGFYGLLMKHCNTLPLSSNHKVMNEFMNATENLLKKGNLLLIYPEQSLWWNYRKPKPLRKGAFIFAAKYKAPVIPCFITMADSKYIDGDGFPVQEYTIHISKPLYPKDELNRNENVEYLMSENYRVWKEIYETTYRIPLVYEKD